MKIFGREPAVVLGILAAAIQLIGSWLLPLSDTQQGALNAVAVALVGAVTAWKVTSDKALPALIGLAQATFALALAFQLDVPANIQAGVMALISAVGAAWVRTQVTALVPVGALLSSEAHL